MVYLHFEDATPEHTLKVAIGGAPMKVRDALSSFAQSYGATGYEMSSDALVLMDGSGNQLPMDAVLPCGLPHDADIFVLSTMPPAPLAAERAAVAAAAAKTASMAVGYIRPSAAAPPSAPMSTEEQRQKHVYAKPGSAVAASQAKMGENSYYYSVGKNRAADPTGVVTPSVPVAAREPKAVVIKPASLPEATITSYSMLDDEAVIKVHIPLAGASSLEAGAIVAEFRERSFDLKVAHENKQHRMHVPILCQEIDPAKSLVKKRAGKLIVVLQKKKPDDPWYELRKTKGVGDSEYNKLVQDSGETTTFTL